MKKMRLLAITLILALTVLGASYATWSDNMPISGTVATGELDWYFENFGQKDDGRDWICAPGFTNITRVNTIDLAQTTIDSLDTDGDGDDDTLKVTVTNAYPGYYNSPYVTMVNNGTIPLKIQQPIITSPPEISVQWTDGVGEVLAKDQSKNIFYKFRVNESARDQTTYIFTIKITGIQWDAN